MRGLLAIVVAAMMVVCSHGASAGAADLKVKAFFGTFKGTGISENRDSLYFGVTVRDFDVTIRSTDDDGFEVHWVTVIRRGGDPNKPKVRRKAQKMKFVPSGKSGIFRSPGSADPLSGAPYSWARISGTTLYIYIMTINADGAYEVQGYSRTLTPTGMEFVFQRIRDGDSVRTVKGKLIRISE